MSTEYQRKKSFYDNMLTIYGRKAVLEALQDNSLELYKIHLADSNKSAPIVDEIINAAKKRNVELQWHDKQALSRISKNSKQDQGVAADIFCRQQQDYKTFLENQQPALAAGKIQLIAVDGVTNPQNLGMIIRSVCAGNLDGILLPAAGVAAIGPLVIKASSGTVFKTPIIRCQSLPETLNQFKKQNTEICVLSSHTTESLFDYKPTKNSIYVLGNESEGVSHAVATLADRSLVIPMNNGVESMNVAVTAALVAFRLPLAAARDEIK